MEKKLKHLEFIQNVITRMNSNSFLLKGWTITLLAALFALAAKDANSNFALISLIVIPAFWLMDGFYLSTERQFTILYKKVSCLDENRIDFNMNPKKYNVGRNTWFRSSISRTIVLFYSSSFITSTIVWCFLKTCQCK
jgi:hypothetical protein